MPEQLIAGAAAGGFLLLFALAYPRGMGMGDVKLAAVLGLFLGRSVGVALMVGVRLGHAGRGGDHGPGGRRQGAQDGGAVRAVSWPSAGSWPCWPGQPLVHWYLHSVI